MKFRYGVTVTRLRRQLVPDPYSGEDTLSDWSQATERAFAGCAVVPVSSEEAPTVDRQALASMRTLFAPYGSDFTPEDRVRLADGSIWNVAGHPEHWHNAFTDWHAGTVVHLKRQEVRQ